MTSSTRRFISLPVVSVCLAATPVIAAPAAPNAANAPTSAATSNDDPKAIARALALEGSRTADGGDHEKALGLFRNAYALYREPAYLYDIAVECQTLGRDDEALDTYERFLANPGATPPEFVTHATQQRDEIRVRRRAPAPPEGALAPTITDENRDGARTSVVQRIAWQASAGAGFWTAGMRGDASAAPVFSVGAGYLVGTLPGDLDVRVGAKVAFSYFKEPSDTDTFTSMLANPAIVKRLGTRLSVYGEVGMGLVVISGVPDNSALLVPSGGRVTGALSAFELRPAIGIAYAMMDGLALHVSPSFAWIARPQERFEHGALTRIDVSAGVTGQL